MDSEMQHWETKSQTILMLKEFRQDWKEKNSIRMMVIISVVSKPCMWLKRNRYTNT